MVKADGYGHGAAAVADALFSGEQASVVPSAFAVATLEEAAALPSHDVPVMCMRPTELIWSPGGTDLLDDAIRQDVWLSVISPESATDLARIADRLGTRANVQVLLDTGMSREMCDPRHFAATVERVLSRPELRLCGVGTHFTDGEAIDESFSDDQVWLFHEAIAPFEAKLPKHTLRHAANSGGTLGGHGAADHFDLVRTGIALYGIDPVADGSGLDLLPVARWTAPLLTIRDLPTGATVGYNRTWTARQQTRIGLIPVGYADGYRRDLSGRATVRLDGPEKEVAQCPLVGRVSMDYLSVDLTPAPWCQPGDLAILLDDDPASPCSAASLAGLCDTIPYEILCNIGRRVQRRLV